MRVELTSVRNARELGGYRTADGMTVKSGVLLRTGRLDDISDEDKYILQNQYHVSDVIDFRMDMERVKTNFPDGAEYHHVDIIDDSRLAKKPIKAVCPKCRQENFCSSLKQPKI